MSFSTKNRATNILLGVALGSFLSHGLAITFGSHIGILGNTNFIYYLKIVTYLTFLLFGITGFLKQEKADSVSKNINPKSNLLKFLNSLTKNCILLVALTIAIGELGDKTFLSSIGLGLQYPQFRFSLILGAICGMVVSDSIAIFFGKWLGSKISNATIEILSNTIFILFGFIGILGLLI